VWAVQSQPACIRAVFWMGRLQGSLYFPVSPSVVLDMGRDKNDHSTWAGPKLPDSLTSPMILLSVFTDLAYLGGLTSSRSWSGTWPDLESGLLWCLVDHGFGQVYSSACSEV
jgi:hypothetical protein